MTVWTKRNSNKCDGDKDRYLDVLAMIVVMVVFAAWIFWSVFGEPIVTFLRGLM